MKRGVMTSTMPAVTMFSRSNITKVEEGWEEYWYRQLQVLHTRKDKGWNRGKGTGKNRGQARKVTNGERKKTQTGWNRGKGWGWNKVSGLP